MITMALMLLSLVTTACGQANQTDNKTEKDSNMEKKILTVFFSMKGETYMAGDASRIWKRAIQTFVPSLYRKPSVVTSSR